MQHSLPKIGVLIVAYNAENTLTNVLDRIPSEFAPQISAVLVCDDASHDQTHDAALAYQRSTTHLPLHVVRHPINLGYGGNQKAGYAWAQELGLDRQFELGQTHGLLGDFGGQFGTTHLKEDATGLDHGHPELWVALTRAHPGFGRAHGDGLVREDPDPDLAAPLDVAAHGPTAGFNLAGGDPATFLGLKRILTEGNRGAPGGDAAHAAPLLFAEIDSFRT